MAKFNAKAAAAALLEAPGVSGRPEFPDLAAAAYLVSSHPVAGVDIQALWPAPLAQFRSGLSAEENRELAQAILAEGASRSSSAKAA